MLGFTPPFSPGSPSFSSPPPSSVVTSSTRRQRQQQQYQPLSSPPPSTSISTSLSFKTSSSSSLASSPLRKASLTTSRRVGGVARPRAFLNNNNNSRSSFSSPFPSATNVMGRLSPARLRLDNSCSSALVRVSRDGGSLRSVPLLPQPNPLAIPELLHTILTHVLALSPALLASCLRVSKGWWAAGSGVLWREVRMEDCEVLLRWKREKRMKAVGWKEIDEGICDRRMHYLASISYVHITEIVVPGRGVDVLVLRKKYPLMTPFINLRRVILHRLSPAAFYREDFTYTVRNPDMYLELSSTRCIHLFNVLEDSTTSPETRYLAFSPGAYLIHVPHLEDPATLVWIQTSVFAHYQNLSDFVLDMPRTWSLEPMHAVELLRAIAVSPNRSALRRLVLSCPIPVGSLHLISSPSEASASDVASDGSLIGGAMYLQHATCLEVVELEAAFEDEHVAVLARAWPNLRELTLRAPALRERKELQEGRWLEPKLTIQSLRAFATHNRRLLHLELDTLSWDANGDDDDGNLKPLSMALHPLPVFSPSLEHLSITGWSHLPCDPAELLETVLLPMVSSHADVHVGVLVFGGIEDLFMEPDEREMRRAGVELINGRRRRLAEEYFFDRSD